MGELFVISASYLFATLIDNRLVLWRQKKRERITPLYHRDQYASDLLKYTTKLLILLLIIKRGKKYSRSIFTIFARHLFTEEGNFDARYFQIITGERFKLTKSSSRVKNVLFPLCPSLLCEKEKEIERKNKTSTPLPPSFEFIRFTFEWKGREILFVRSNENIDSTLHRSPPTYIRPISPFSN